MGWWGGGVMGVVSLYLPISPSPPLPTPYSPLPTFFESNASAIAPEIE
ncbi:hypothetical protein H1Q63_06855 [Desmonostoc muscorum CCALA 125]|nr:hypothetical protein [Desmonostoc muscorum CCALA 125]